MIGPASDRSATPVAAGFDRLHPSVQHHVVNSLGWRSLRPLQTQTIDPILDGDHVIATAPTAGGKTEAAVLPLLSRMLSEDWTGLSVLYLCPLRALLNNLQPRLERYAALVGRTCALWHGDVGAAERRRLLADPPDILLTTPESLEAMLVSTGVAHDRWFADLQAVVIDEVHAFANDDRGWHLLAILARIGRLSGRELQRVALSATVGNPAELLTWMTASCHRPGQVIAPPAEATVHPEVTLDYVGSLDNAALVISRLHRGEKRLVFVDSRSRAERLAYDLSARGVTTFVSHGSLSASQRRLTEAAFAEARDCVIVATSTLELGIDVGDLDRVIQIDSPPSVASFLQRLGRSGRRAGTTRAALFLATDDDALERSAGMLLAWSRGYVEPVTALLLPITWWPSSSWHSVCKSRGSGGTCGPSGWAHPSLLVLMPHRSPEWSPITSWPRDIWPTAEGGCWESGRKQKQRSGDGTSSNCCRSSPPRRSFPSAMAIKRSAMSPTRPSWLGRAGSAPVGRTPWSWLVAVGSSATSTGSAGLSAWSRPTSSAWPGGRGPANPSALSWPERCATSSPARTRRG